MFYSETDQRQLTAVFKTYVILQTLNYLKLIIIFNQLKVLKHFLFLFCTTAIYLVSFIYFCRFNVSAGIPENKMVSDCKIK